MGLFRDPGDEQLLCDALRAFTEEWGPEFVTVTVPADWKRFSKGSLGRVALLFHRKNSVSIEVHYGAIHLDFTTKLALVPSNSPFRMASHELSRGTSESYFKRRAKQLYELYLFGHVDYSYRMMFNKGMRDGSEYCASCLGQLKYPTECHFYGSILEWLNRHGYLSDVARSRWLKLVCAKRAGLDFDWRSEEHMSPYLKGYTTAVEQLGGAGVDESEGDWERWLFCEFDE